MIHARNAGIDASTGNYLMFIDSDDYIAPEMAEKLYRSLLENKTPISICNYILTDEAGTPVPDTNTTLTDEVFSGEEAIRRLVNRKSASYVISCNKLYNREVFSTLRFPYGKVHEDEFLAHHLFDQCAKVSSISDICYYYRKHVGSIMATPNYKERLHALESAADRIALCKGMGLSNELSLSYSDLVFGFSNLGSVPKEFKGLKPEIMALRKCILSNLTLCRFCPKNQIGSLILAAICPPIYRFAFHLTHPSLSRENTQ